MPWGVWDFSPLTRDGTHAHCSESRVQTTGLAGEPLNLFSICHVSLSNLKPLNEDPNCFRQEVNYVDLALTQLKQIVINYLLLDPVKWSYIFCTLITVNQQIHMVQPIHVKHCPIHIN